MTDKEKLSEILFEYGLVGGLPAIEGLSKYLTDRGVVVQPAADVAPRAEVAREIFEEMDKIMLPLLHEVSQVYIYTKLRKKYTEV